MVSLEWWPGNSILCLISLDVVCKYCFGYSNNLLDKPDFYPQTIINLEEGLKMGPLLQHNFWMMQLLQALPEWLSAWLVPAYGGFVKEKNVRYRPEFDPTSAYLHTGIWGRSQEGHGIIKDLSGGDGTSHDLP